VNGKAIACVAADLEKIIACSRAGGARRNLTGIANRDPNRRSPFSRSSQISLDRKGFLPFSNNDEEAFQLCIARQIPAGCWIGQASDRFVIEEQADISHSHFSNGFWGLKRY